jgi:hypothetical protein
MSITICGALLAWIYFAAAAALTSASSAAASSPSVWFGTEKRERETETPGHSRTKSPLEGGTEEAKGAQ